MKPQFAVVIHNPAVIAKTYVYGDSMTTPLRHLALPFTKLEAQAYAASMAQVYGPRREAAGMEPLGFSIEELP